MKNLININVLGAVAACLFLGGASAAPLVWNGPPTTFSRAGSADSTLPQNQDRLTDTVWITRGNTQGLFNIKQEGGFTHSLSPAGTEWAYGSAANWPSLTFSDWEAWARNSPTGAVPGIVGEAAVLHLIADDIYLDIRFHSWASTSGGGGAFSYERSTVVPEPSNAALLGVTATALLRRIRRRH